VRRNQLRAALLWSSFALAVLSACSLDLDSEEQRRAALEDEARSVIPSGTETIGVEPGGCVEFADFPSCVTVLFTHKRSLPLDRRVQIAERTAEANEWRFTERRIGPGGVELRYERGNFEARIVLWKDPETTCAQRSLRDCGAFVDHVQVVQP
jgi:hypothetical protein